MQTEIEAKFLAVDHEDIRGRLQTTNAVCEQPMRLMRRAIIDYEDERLQKNNSYIRIRDEGDKVTLTFKKFDSNTIDGAKEINLVVNDFEAAKSLFVATGLTVVAYQESKRETWKLGEVEVVLDEWPWLKPYMEIEGPTQKSVQQAAKELELEWKDAVFGDVTEAYKMEYDVDVDKVGKSDFVFGAPIPDWLKEAKR